MILVMVAIRILQCRLRFANATKTANRLGQSGVLGSGQGLMEPLKDVSTTCKEWITPIGNRPQECRSWSWCRGHHVDANVVGVILSCYLLTMLGKVSHENNFCTTWIAPARAVTNPLAVAIFSSRALVVVRWSRSV